MIEGYDNKLLQTFEYETTAISNKKIIGTCELGKATIQLINDSNTYSDLKKTWIKTKFGSFYIDNVEPVQEKVNIKLSCYDIKYKLDSEYDSDLYTWPQTLKKWRNAIFDNCGVEYDDSDFPNSDLILNYEPDLNNSKTNRQVLCIIAQAGASWIETDENDKFFFKWFTENVFVAKDWSSLTTEKQASSSINLVILSRGDVGDDVYYPKTKPSNPVEFKIENNYILDPQSILNTEDLRETTIIPIYNQVNGFSYIVFNLTSTLIDKKLSIKLGDKIKYTDIWGNELTSYVMSRKISYIGGDIEDDDNYQITLSAEEIEETNTELSTGTNVIEEMKTISRKADKNTGLIEDLVEETDVQNQKISKVTQTVDELNSKISDIADITISGESDYAFIELDNINISEPIRINIKPNSDDISYLYPNDNLYPSDTLYLKNRKIRFINKTTEEIFDYELPDNLFFYDNDNYDEFILDYDAQSCIINKKVGINADGSKYLLDTQTTIEYDYPKIELADGDYKIELLGYSNAYIFVRLMAQNIYTTQFATRTEVNSQINQTSEEINLEVSKKVGEDEIISKINQTSEEVKVNASKISLEGIITANGNVKITEDGSIKVNNGTFNGDIYLPTGGKVIGGDGILTNLQFASDTKFNELGFYSAMSSEANYRSQIVINADIPSNFTVTSAKLTLVHVPVKWHDGSSGASFWGRSQNVRVYKTNSVSNMYFELYAHSDGSFLNEESKYEIANAFSGGYFTASSASDNSHSAQTVETVDMSSNFTVSGLHRITLQSADSIPNYTGVYSTDLQNTYQKTGYVFAILNILGYTSMN